MNYYPHHIADFNNATRHLTVVERAFYRELIELYYTTEKPLPANDFDALARVVLARSDDEKAALRAVLSEFFTLDGDLYRNKRCDAEILVYQEKLANSSKAGKASALARAKQKVNKRSTGVKQPFNDCATNQEPITNNQISAERFVGFWKSYPKKVAKPEAEKAFAKVADEFDSIMSGLEVAKASVQWAKNKGEFIPNPSTFLNQRRWEDEYTTAQQPGQGWEA